MPPCHYFCPHALTTKIYSFIGFIFTLQRQLLSHHLIFISLARQTKTVVGTFEVYLLGTFALNLWYHVDVLSPFYVLKYTKDFTFFILLYQIHHVGISLPEVSKMIPYK